MRRVMIVGGPGSGKSWLAIALAGRTGLPVVHMDHIHYRPGWVERDKTDKDRLTAEVHARDAWIFEGGHSRTYPERLKRADTLIWLDVPLGLRILRVARRAWIHRGRTRPDLPEGCPETPGRATLALIGYMIRSRTVARARHAAICERATAPLRVWRLRSLRDVDAFLARARRADPGAVRDAEAEPMA